MDYNNFINKWRANNEDEIKKRRTLENSNETLPETAFPKETVPEDKTKKGSI